MLYGPKEIQKLKKVESLIPPVIAKFPNKRVVFFRDGPNIEITNDVTLDMVMKRWIKKKYQKSIAVNNHNREWKVESSKPGSYYMVKSINGVFSCTCKGYQFRGNCRHIKEIKESSN